MLIIQSKLLKQFKNILQGFTTKQNGNLAFHVGDKEKSVRENHKTLASKLGYDYKSLVHMNQIHSNKCTRVQTVDNYLHPPTCDALITDKRNIPLMVMVADCSPLLFYDAKKNIISVAHAGRSGTFANIVQNVVEKFTTTYNSQLEDIFVSIGASIKECCYEVGEDIVKEAEVLSLSYAISKEKDSYYLNISQILYNQLLEAGIPNNQIEICDECSCCEEKKFYSYRRDKVTGRFAGILMLK